jgi:Ras-related protein Rab-5C
MNTREGNERNFKVVMIGESGVGKTCIVRKFIKGTFGQYEQTTIGANYFTKTL